MAQRGRIRTVHLGRDYLHAIDIHRARCEIGAGTAGEPILQRADFAFHLTHAFERFADFVTHVFARGAHESTDLFQYLVALFDVLECRLARQSFDAPHAGCDAAFAHDLEKADVASAL